MMIKEEEEKRNSIACSNDSGPPPCAHVECKAIMEKSLWPGTELWKSHKSTAYFPGHFFNWNIIICILKINKKVITLRYKLGEWMDITDRYEKERESELLLTAIIKRLRHKKFSRYQSFASGPDFFESKRHTHTLTRTHYYTIMKSSWAKGAPRWFYYGHWPLLVSNVCQKFHNLLQNASVCALLLLLHSLRSV